MDPPLFISVGFSSDLPPPGLWDGVSGRRQCGQHLRLLKWNTPENQREWRV